jgi:hypothetical protein
LDIYITTASMLGSDKLKKLFAARSRKESSLYIYCGKDAKLAIPVVNELLNAPSKISIKFIEIAGKSDFAFSIGLLVGTKQQIYTILPDDYKISDSVKEQYGIKTYDPASDTQPRTTRTRKKSSPKEEASETADTKALVSDVEKKTEDSASDASAFEEPLFFSEDSEKFFYAQLDLNPEEIGSTKSKEEIGQIVAECMKAAADDERLLHFRLEEEFGETANIVFDHVKKDADLLKGCLFIVRK